MCWFAMYFIEVNVAMIVGKCILKHFKNTEKTQLITALIYSVFMQSSGANDNWQTK